MTYCLLITGLPNSGKTTLAYELLQKHLRNCLVIDGDKHREMQFLGRKLTFSKEDIMLNNSHVLKLAQFAQEQGINVLISQIMPYREQREEIKLAMDNVLEIYCFCPERIRASRPNYHATELTFEDSIDSLQVHTGASIDDCVVQILLEMGKRGFI